MQELERILEEIEQKQVILKPFDAEDRPTGIINVDIVKEIIRKHINDGWIPVEERLPEVGEHVLVSFRSAGFLPATAIISENGRWSMLQGAKGFNDVTNDVISWRHLPEPYRPERSDNHDRE